MTIQECITFVDGIEPNAYTDAQKTQWVLEAEKRIYMQVFLQQFVDYRAESVLSQELSVPSPYDRIYPDYLQAKIHYANGEYDRYDNSMQLFNQAWAEVNRWFGRDFDVSDRIRNDRITVPIRFDVTQQTLFTLPQRYALVAGRIVVQEPFTQTGQSTEIAGQIWYGNSGSVVGQAEMSEIGSSGVRMLMGDVHGTSIGFTLSAEADAGEAYFTGIVCRPEEELLYNRRGGGLQEMNPTELPTSPYDIGAQPLITAAGLLKGNGSGVVAAAVPDVDYATPEMVPTTPEDIGALAADGTADRAKQLSMAHYFTVTQDQWYKIFEMQMTTSMARHLLLTINNTGSRYCGIVYCYFNRNAIGVASSTRVRWLAIEGFSASDLRVTDATENGVTTFSLYLRARTSNYVFISTIRTMSRTGTADVSDYWLSEAVSAPPDDAITALLPIADMSGAVPSDASGAQAATHTISGNAGWYKFFEFALPTNASRNLDFWVQETYYSGSGGILRVYMNRAAGDATCNSWITAGRMTALNVRREIDGGKVTLYIKKTVNTGKLVFKLINAYNRSGSAVDVSDCWQAEAVSEPVSAIPVGVDVLNLTSVPVSAGSNAEIVNATDDRIGVNMVLVRIEFANPEYITASGSWETTSGSFTMTGTATASTTANVLLVRRENAV